jgi:hypothetical protein
LGVVVGFGMCGRGHRFTSGSSQSHCPLPSDGVGDGIG